MGRNQVGFALVWLILFSTSVLQIRCSLAAYSETRSFRDALEGRSMEEALSGPVDRDTSSYGDRTSSMSGSPSATTGSQSPASSMMLSIPANGNLQQQQVDGPQQQQSMNGRDSELERETASMNDGLGGTPMEGQQQLMEQKQFGRQLAQTARRMAGRYMLMQLQKQNARQQQQVDDSKSFGTKSTANGESGFGEESQSGKGLESKLSDSSLTTPSYSSNRQQVEQSKQAADSNEDQPGIQRQQQMNDVEQQAVERGYSSSDTADQPQQQQQAVKQRAMAAMLMSMNNAMKYSQRSSANIMTTTMLPTLAAQIPIQQQQQQVSDSPSNIDNFENNVKGSSIARNPMQMSLRNNNKQMAYGLTNMQANQRQIAPPMMISTLINETNQQSNFNEQAPAGKLRGSRGGMRRASQRKMEKKMSPAMVNAMLNKMLNLKPSANNENGNNEQQGYMKPAAMAMLMKSPAGAELLANMAMGPQMVGAIAGMSTAKKEQYKRMMMAAIMQQAGNAMAEGRGNEYLSGAGQQQQLDDSYSTTEQSVTKGAKNGAGSGPSSRGYGTMAPTFSSPEMAPLSPVTMMMNAAMNAGRGSFRSYEQNLQEQQQVTDDATTTMSPENYASRMARKTMNGKDGRTSYARKMMMTAFNDQQQQQMVMDGGKASGMARSMTSNKKPVSMMTDSMAYAVGPMGMSSVTTDGNSVMNNGRGMKTSSSGNGVGKFTGKQQQQQQQLDEQQKKSYGGFGDSEQQQQELISPSKMGQGEGEQMNEQMGGMNSYASMVGGQQEMPMSTQSPASPKQNSATRLQKSSYSSQMRQQQGMSSNGGLTAVSGMGPSKRAQMPVQQMIQDDYTTSMPMARPMPVQMSFGTNSKDQQQQQLVENNGPIEQQQKEIDDFSGGAPMGMAEPFAFDYKVEDDYGNGHYRKEESDKNGVVRGSYGYMDVNGLYRHVDYVADENGFRANVKSNEPGLSGETSQTNSGATSSVGNSNSLMSNSALNSPSSSTTQLEVNNQMMSMDTPGDSTIANIQQQQQQMLPTQAELNENGEK